MLFLQKTRHEKGDIFLSFLFNTQLGLLDKSENMMGAHFYACRVSLTLVAAESLVGMGINEAGPKWAGEYTSLASDTQVRVDNHDVGIWISISRTGRASILARRPGTIVAQSGCVGYFPIIDVSGDSNSRNKTVALAHVPQRTGHLTNSASRTFRVINGD